MRKCELVQAPTSSHCSKSDGAIKWLPSQISETWNRFFTHIWNKAVSWAFFKKKLTSLVGSCQLHFQVFIQRKSSTFWLYWIGLNLYLLWKEMWRLSELLRVEKRRKWVSIQLKWLSLSVRIRASQPAREELTKSLSGLYTTSQQVTGIMVEYYMESESRRGLRKWETMESRSRTRISIHSMIQCLNDHNIFILSLSPLLSSFLPSTLVHVNPINSAKRKIHF